MSKEPKEAVNLVLSEKSPSTGPSLVEAMLKDLQAALPGVFTDLSQAGRSWIRGKSAQEVARAHEVLSVAVDRIAKLALEEREQTHRQDLERKKHDAEQKREQLELYFDSLERAAKIVRELAEAGVDVNVTAFFRDIAVQARPRTDSQDAIGESS